MLSKEKIELARQGECTFFHPFCNFMTTALGTVAIAAGPITDFQVSAIRTSAENAVPHGRGTTFFNVKNSAYHLWRSIVSPKIFLRKISAISGISAASFEQYVQSHRQIAAFVLLSDAHRLKLCDRYDARDCLEHCVRWRLLPEDAFRNNGEAYER